MTTEIEREDKLEKKFVNKLPEDWRVRVQAMDNAQIRAEIVSVASNENENQKKKDDDVVLADVKEAYAAAGAEYKEATSMNKLRIKFLLRELSNNGAA